MRLSKSSDDKTVLFYFWSVSQRRGRCYLGGKAVFALLRVRVVQTWGGDRLYMAQICIVPFFHKAEMIEDFPTILQSSFLCRIFYHSSPVNFLLSFPLIPPCLFLFPLSQVRYLLSSPHLTPRPPHFCCLEGGQCLWIHAYLCEYAHTLMLCREFLV